LGLETCLMTTVKTETRDGSGGRAVHDVGGLDFGPIDRDEHDLTLWERRVDAMMILMYAKKGCFTVDAMRRTIEDYGQQTYDKTTYYEKWLKALRNLVIEQQVLSADEIDQRMRDVAARQRAAGRTVVADRLEG
jgi:hypothetical protein